MKNPIVEAINLNKVYKMGEIKVNALNDVSFKILTGEFVVILGPSGSGKSTLLNLIGGMDNSTSGSIVFENKNISNYNDKELTYYRRNDIGFVFQFYNLIANLTARENVEIATEICNDPLNIDEVIESVNLLDRANHFPSQLSGGEQQRVAIARAVCKNPKILLCDEPTGALDFETGKSILKVLKTVNENYKRTVIVITHNASIASMADRIIKMRSGKIIENIINKNKINPERIEW